jgi:hypothetical protein
MRTLSRFLVLLTPLPCLLSGQNWEVGGAAGYGLSRDVPVTAGSASGSTGLAPGVAFGALLGNQISTRIGGEARYTYQSNDLRVSSGSTKATAGAESHAIHYDVLIHAAKDEAPVRPFLAAGAGVRLYRGTGGEPSFQPLNNLVVLSHTNEAQPLISVGGGVKFSIGRRALLRLDFRDYATPLPSSLLAAPPNSKITGWVHDFVFLIGISALR